MQLANSNIAVRIIGFGILFWSLYIVCLGLMQVVFFTVLSCNVTGLESLLEVQFWTSNCFLSQAIVGTYYLGVSDSELWGLMHCVTGCVQVIFRKSNSFYQCSLLQVALTMDDILEDGS